ncbi:glycosyltransferase family 2 protein [Halobacillus hunanensis]|uniref:glycosyltransferase family 2 protein n=1 Tax=Halobacillus hunanensis TaxID=578214 RepID=UPI0009A66C56|nr:glycosyltransferase family 2 protein [Halobacillus hunanensis]
MNRLINKINSKILSTRKFTERIRYNKNGYYLVNQSNRSNYKVSVIVPVYNAEKTIKKTVDSVIAQSIGFENIELLIVDDLSTDDSRVIIYEYAKAYKNIKPVFMEGNSGGPSIPRNIGISLARGKYLTFIDSDDWFEETGLEALYNLIEKTGDKYAVGRTVKTDDKGLHFIGEYNTCINRESIDPFSIKQTFHHLGPPGKIMSTSFIQENKIVFPDMKFAEDKQFFIDVLTNCESISTTTEVIYYANRYKENESFTTTTSIFEKTDTNISLINYVINKGLPIDKEKIILNRLYEFDCITRLFDRYHFLRATNENKKKYFDKFSEVLETTERIKYDFTDNFNHPWHKILVELYMQEDYDGLVELINWSRRESIKEVKVENKLPYYLLPLSKPYDSARVHMYAHFEKMVKHKEALSVYFKVYGELIEKLQSFVLRQRNYDLKEVDFPLVKVEGNLYKVDIPFEELYKISSASYAVFIRYNDYEKLRISMLSKNIVQYQKRTFDFYTTASDNFGIKIK